jgi:hypothetical protein
MFRLHSLSEGFTGQKRDFLKKPPSLPPSRECISRIISDFKGLRNSDNPLMYLKCFAHTNMTEK